jgi:methanogenic corrinoid protein MtbC1
MNSQRKQQAELIQKVTDLEENEVLAMVRKRLESGDDPLEIIEDCQEGMRRVGLRYEAQEYFLSGLIMAGEIFREVMEIVQPVIEESHQGDESGVVLLGTVQGDIHDIGKNNLSMLLTCYGFTVIDLGIDVPPKVFLEAAEQTTPDIIGLSGLMTASYDSMLQTINLLRNYNENKFSKVPIVIGGSQINDEICRYVGADDWVADAMHGVRLCQRLLAEGREPV